MKKSIFSLIALAIASVSVFTSCDKNDDGYGQSAKTQATTTTTTPSVSPTMASTAKLSFNAFAVSEDLAKYGTFTVTFFDGTDTKEFDIVKDGKLGTYTTVKNTTCKGYVLAIAVPYSSSIKTTVKYTLNDAGKALTEKDKIDATFGFCHTTLTDPSTPVKFNGSDAKEYAGNHLAELCNAMTSLMTL